MENNEISGAKYYCIECKHETRLKPKDTIVCSNCGKNILYKVRNKSSPVEVLAR